MEIIYRPPGNYFNTTRLNLRRIRRVIKATSLQEATKMGLFDKIFDKFLRNGGKRKRIIELYQQLTEPDSCESSENTPIKMASKFNKLREIANEDYKHDFQIAIHQDMEQPDRWSYSFSIEKYLIYQSEPLDYCYENNFNELCALKIGNDFENDFDECKEHLSQENFIASRIQTMSDNKSVIEKIHKELDNPNYAKDKLLGLFDAENSDDIFFVHFKSDLPELSRHVLELSNRGNENGEFRGSLLKKAIQESHYKNLRELCSHGFMTKDDSLLVYFSTPHKFNLINYIGKDNLGNVQHILRNKKVGNTNLCELFKLDLPERVS